MVCDFKIRNENHKRSDLEKINKVNDFIGKRITNRSSNLSFKKMNDDFLKTQNFKHLSSKFRLPDIEKIGLSIAKVDISTFNRRSLELKLQSNDVTFNCEGLSKTPVYSLPNKSKITSVISNEKNGSNFLKFKFRVNNKENFNNKEYNT